MELEDFGDRDRFFFFRFRFFLFLRLFVFLILSSLDWPVGIFLVLSVRYMMGPCRVGDWCKGSMVFKALLCGWCGSLQELFRNGCGFCFVTHGEQVCREHVARAGGRWERSWM